MDSEQASRRRPSVTIASGLLILIAFNLLFLVSPRTSSAWETDVHLGLTEWLALKAGLPKNAAARLAAADQSLDDSDYSAAVWAVIYVAVRGDKVAAEFIRDYHFPSHGSIPSAPAHRRVQPNSSAARYAVNAAFNNGLRLDRALERLGKGLHTLQDSWSHAGVPDSPARPWFLLRPDMTVGHPLARGGWCRHDADLTHLYPHDAERAAFATYNVLQTFCSRRPKLGCARPARWSSLRRLVRKFAAAKSTDMKRAWFLRQGFSKEEAARFVAATSLPGERYYTAPSRTREKGEPPRYLVSIRDVPAGMRSTLDRFLRTWIVKGSSSAALEYVALNVVADTLKFGKIGEAAGWVSRLMRSFLVPNPAIVDLCAAIASPPASTRREYASIEEAIEGPIAGQSYVIVAADIPGLRDAPYAAIFRFKLAPRTALALVMGRRAGRWRVLMLIPVVS